MFDELRELADTVREHAPVVVDELHRAVESLVIGAESLARIADRLDALNLPAISRDQLTIDQEVTK